MTSTTDKIKGYANEAAGGLKKGIGKLTGSEKLQAEGAGQKLRGETQVAIGKAKDAVKSAANKTANKIDEI